MTPRRAPGLMNIHRVRSSHVEAGPRHCPAAVAFARLDTPREPSSEMMVGKAVHAVLEAVALTEGDDVSIANAAVVEMCRNGLSFEGGPPETPTLEEACAGRRLALAYLDKHPLPVAEFLQAELEVNLTPNGWAVIDGECPECNGGSLIDDPETGEMLTSDCSGCQTCGGAGEIWPPHWHQLLDLAWQAHEEDAYENPVLVAGGRDYKGWDAGEAWFGKLQGVGYAVALATLFPDAQIIRRECAGYQLRHLYTDEIDLREEEGRDRLDLYREEIALAVKTYAGQSLDIETLAMPGPGCYAGYDGCAWLPHCPPGLRRGSRLLEAVEPGNKVAYADIETSADAYALGNALGQEGAKQLKKYGGGPILTASGHCVGWKDTTSPEGKVDENASFWLAREYANFVLKDEAKAPEIEGVIRAAGVGKSGGGVTVVRKIAAKCVAAGMGDDEEKALLARCLKPKPKRALSIWRGPLPEPEEDPALVKALRDSITTAKEEK